MMKNLAKAVAMLAVLCGVSGKSVETVLTNNQGLTFTYWTQAEGSEFPGYMVLYGIIEMVDYQQDLSGSGAQLRIGLEIALPNREYEFREQILFIADLDYDVWKQVNLGTKNGENLDKWNEWTKNKWHQNNKVLEQPYESGVQIINKDSNINKKQRKARVAFKRKFIVDQRYTMDLNEGLNYKVYFTHGVFSAWYDQNTANVKGDTDPENADRPLFLNMRLQTDTWSGALTTTASLGLAALTLAASVAF